MTKTKQHRHLSWERFRFAIIGPLLAAPPEPGQLQAAFRTLAAKYWIHPLNSTQRIQVGLSTLERWYYKALRSTNPVDSLKRAHRKDAGQSRVLSSHLHNVLESQYHQQKHWSVQLHYDNLKAIACQDSALHLPSYSTVLRHMKAQAWHPTKRRQRMTQGMLDAERRLQEREVRSFEVEYVNALWHLDFHHSSFQILHPSGHWRKPKLLGIIDDRSRLICHLQWYWEEDTQMLVHGFVQALQKRGLPRALMTDNGSAMTSSAFTQGLHRLSILHETTLPYSPYQNAKQETFWSTLEGRLMAMLVNMKELSLRELNEYSQVWVERDYHQNQHRELKATPLKIFCEHANVARPCPDTQALKRAFREQSSRKQRRSDGTISFNGQRYEVPNAYNSIETIHVRFAPWDMTSLEMIDPHSGQNLCRLLPLNKVANANGQRRKRATKAVPGEAPDDILKSATTPPALLQKLMDEQRASGLPTAYIATEEELSS